ncbi:MAG: dihydropteroate synthase [Microbacter sp.]
MGILNVTPDSFYTDSRVLDDQMLIDRVHGMLDDGASIIDVGGYSTRPFALEVSEKEELARLTHALDIIRSHFPNIVISVDTFRSAVADELIRHFGVDMINDISGGTMDAKMDEVVAFHQVPYVLMHIKGTVQTMHQRRMYQNVIHEMALFFAKRIQHLSEMGVCDIILDPGFGFSKSVEQNYVVLRNLSHFSMFEKPLLVGLSRKSMLYKPLNSDPEHVLAATIAANTMALSAGASILRVHDVKEAVQAVEVYRQTVIAS